MIHTHTYIHTYRQTRCLMNLQYGILEFEQFFITIHNERIIKATQKIACLLVSTNYTLNFEHNNKANCKYDI